MSSASPGGPSPFAIRSAVSFVFRASAMIASAPSFISSWAIVGPFDRSTPRWQLGLLFRHRLHVTDCVCGRPVVRLGGRLDLAPRDVPIVAVLVLADAASAVRAHLVYPFDRLVLTPSPQTGPTKRS